GAKFKPPIVMGWAPGAEAIFRKLADKIRQEPDPLRRQMFVRLPETVVRLATIVAFGRSTWALAVPDVLWAQAVALESAEKVLAGVLKYGTDPQDFAVQCRMVLQMIEDSPDRSDAGNPMMTMRDFTRAFNRIAKQACQKPKALFLTLSY